MRIDSQKLFKIGVIIFGIILVIISIISMFSLIIRFIFEYEEGLFFTENVVSSLIQLVIGIYLVLKMRVVRSVQDYESVNMSILSVFLNLIGCIVLTFGIIDFITTGITIVLMNLSDNGYNQIIYSRIDLMYPSGNIVLGVVILLVIKPFMKFIERRAIL